MQEWASGICALGGAVIGVVGTMVARWLSAKQTERKETRQAIREFRKERARPVLDALDRASAVYSVAWGDIDLLMDEIGYYGERIEPEQKEAYEKERKNRLKERLDRAVEDISTVSRIPDPEVRRVLYRALWKGITRPEVQKEEHLREIDEAYSKLQAWIFRAEHGEA